MHCLVSENERVSFRGCCGIFNIADERKSPVLRIVINHECRVKFPIGYVDEFLYEIAETHAAVCNAAVGNIIPEQPD